MKGIEFPNGANSAMLLTFDIESNFGNGSGSEDMEIENHGQICTCEQMTEFYWQVSF